ncbi:enolase [Candidatus Poribacteria bacterium]|nr:MAG: enolase [Candidatus Poribacteria bacterium]
MKIVDIKTQTFKYKSNQVRDSEGHGHPGPEHDATQTLLTIVTDEGVEGYAFGGSPAIAEQIFKPALIGEDPFYREKLWQRLKHWQRIHRNLTDNVIGVADMALWDLAGRCFDQPVYKLLGGYRDKVLAYASTMCGDEETGGLSSPDDYGRFAEWCIQRGYKAIKLHTWMPPIPWAPDPKMDVKACAAVREAVGDDIPLMLDCYHYYSREQALYIGRELEKLNYYWFEEPMDEHSTSSYVWLAEQLDIPVVGPETAEGKMFTRAEWILRGAADILRGGVGDVGGITPLMKIVHLAESFGMAMEVHGGGGGNLHVLGAMGIPGEFYERGLLHPFIDHDQVEPWLHSKIDAMDDEGYIHLPQGPGLGYDINFDYIKENTVETKK